MGYTPHILVIGGGIIGTGIARDFAIRGLDVTLVERCSLASGATGRRQELLSSGARIADANPELARRCLVENRTLRETAGNCVDTTDGLLVAHADDDDTFERSLSAAEACDIPVEVLDGDAAREAEPGLSDAVERAMRVPDGVVDPVKVSIENARGAREFDAEIRTHTTVTDIAVDGGTVDTVTLEYDPSPPGSSDDEGHEDDGDHEGTDDDPVTDGGRDDSPETPHYGPGGQRPGGPGSGVPGALVPGSSVKTQLEQRTEEVEPDYVVNAAGAWAGTVGELAGIDLHLEHSTATVVEAQGGHVDVPVTRCRDSHEANTVVPDGDTCLLGTAYGNAEGPDDCTGRQADIDLLVEQIPDVVPGLQTCRALRADCAVRAWHSAGTEGGERAQVPSAASPHEFTLLDHGDRDDCWGMTTVVGGSVTTHRLVAERVVDDVCRKFGITRGCRTDEIPLPGTEDRSQAEPPGVGTHDGPDPVVCECQSVTREEISAAIGAESESEVDLNEIRLRTTASMGDCQGGRCAHRLAAQLYPDYDAETVEDALTALLDDRWQGQRLALWGDQLAQAMETYDFHVRTLHRNGPDVDFMAERPDHTGETEEGTAPSADSFRLGAFDGGPSPATDGHHQWGERQR